MEKSFHPSGSSGTKALDMFAINHGSIDVFDGGGGNALHAEIGSSCFNVDAAGHINAS